MLLENENIKLRALEPEDLDILYKWENKPELWAYGNTLSPYSKLALKQYITQTQQQDIFEAKQLRLMIEQRSSNSLIGTIDLYDFDFHHKRAGVGILIDPDVRKQGYAFQALSLIKEYAFSFLQLKQLYAFIAADNDNSISLFEKATYTKSSTLKSWICTDKQYKDVHIYQLIND